jgi:hypothetical protein
LLLPLLWGAISGCSGGGDPADTKAQESPDAATETITSSEVASSPDTAADSTAPDLTSKPDPGQTEDTAQVTDAGQNSDEGSMTYLGGWTKATCQNETVGTGTKQGDIAYDFQQMDQYGEPLRLHDFCDRFVLLVGSAYW